MDTLIGLTVIAFGTSLPELVTSIVAARKGENDIAIGNVVGSNIFNILFILGVSSVIRPLTIEGCGIFDILILIGCSSLVWLMARPRLKLGRFAGIVMVGIYDFTLRTIFIFLPADFVNSYLLRNSPFIIPQIPLNSI